MCADGQSPSSEPGTRPGGDGPDRDRLSISASSRTSDTAAPGVSCAAAFSTRTRRRSGARGSVLRYAARRRRRSRRAAPRDGQLRRAQAQERQGVAGTEPPVRRALHPDPRLVDEPRRGPFRDRGAPGHPPRRLQISQGPQHQGSAPSSTAGTTAPTPSSGPRGCPPHHDASGRRKACPKRHGSWSYILDIGTDPVTGKRRQSKQGGFKTQADAQKALSDALISVDRGLHRTTTT